MVENAAERWRWCRDQGACWPVAEGDGVIARSFNPAAGKYAGGIAVNKQTGQCFRMVSLRAAASVLFGEFRQIKLADNIGNEIG